MSLEFAGPGGTGPEGLIWHNIKSFARNVGGAALYLTGEAAHMVRHHTLEPRPDPPVDATVLRIPH